MLLAEFVRPVKEAGPYYSEKPDPGIKEYLRKRGFDLIGQGVDQMAFKSNSNPDWVLKVFSAGKGGRPNPGHEMFFVWAQFCMANENNPFLPRFAGYEKFEWAGALYLQIWQEKLNENWDRAEEIEDLAYLVEDYAEVGAADVKILAAARVGRDLKKFKALNYLDDGSFDLLVKTITSLYRMGRSRMWRWDLHAGNVLFRADETPVLVDPWVL